MLVMRAPTPRPSKAHHHVDLRKALRDATLALSEAACLTIDGHRGKLGQDPGRPAMTPPELG